MRFRNLGKAIHRILEEPLNLTFPRIVLAISILFVACASGSARNDPSPTQEKSNRLSAVEAGSLEVFIQRFPDQAQWLGPLQKPGELPDRAISTFQLVAPAKPHTLDSLIWSSPGGRFEGDYYLASGSPRKFSVVVVCLVNGQRRHCNQGVQAFGVDIQPEAFARFPLSLELAKGDRVEILRVIGGETGRLDPASGATVFFAGQRESLPRSTVFELRQKVLGGCDVAAFTSTSSKADNIIRVASKTSPKFLVAEFCDDGPRTVRPILVADGRDVLNLDDFDGFGFTEVTGGTFVAKVPDRALARANSIQAFVLLDPVGDYHVMVSPALRLR